MSNGGGNAHRRCAGRRTAGSGKLYALILAPALDLIYHFPIGQADVSARRTYGLEPAAADPGHRLALRQAAQQALQILRSLHRDLDPPVSLAALSVETISSYALRRLVPVINAKRHTPPACQLYSSYPFGACGGAVGYGAAVDHGAK